MQNDKSKFKRESKGQVHGLTLDVIGFTEQLPKVQVSTILTLKSQR
jgi:hypothetical protein